MVDKVEGATTVCTNGCGTELTCRLKDYGGGYEAKLQWQNPDGTAHYKTSNGKDFTCVIPKDDESQEAPQTTVTPKESSNIPEMDTVTTIYVDKQITLIRQIEARVFSILGADANVQKVGMYVKLILEGINRK